MTRIIAAFPGTGKSYFAEGNNVDGSVLDSDSSSFSWLQVGGGERQRNPAFPGNYIDHIIENLGTASIILVSTHQEVTDALVDSDLDFTLVYPQRELRDEYLDRFKRRGSPEGFIRLIDCNWDDFIDHVEGQAGCQKVELGAGKYLSDIL